MTTPNGAIVFNTGSGSDTLSSGLGPATPVNGSGASTTAASAVVTGINTTGVSSGDLLWVQSSSGRQFSIIASVDSGTQVTCDDTFANTEASRTWAIGGKRATWDNADSRQLFADAAGWTITTETDQTLTSSLTLVGTTSATSPLRIESDTAGTLRTITITINDELFDSTTASSYYYFTDLKFQCSGTSTVGGVDFRSSVYGFFTNCTFGDSTNTLAYAFRRTSSSPKVTFVGCTIEYCTSYGIDLGNNSVSNGVMMDCVIRNNAKGLYRVGASSRYVRCLIYGNTGDGIGGLSSGSNSTISDSVIADNGGYGFNTAGSQIGIHFNGCVFSNNTSGGISFASDSEFNSVINCAFYNDTVTNVVEINSTTLTADPFTDSSSGDYTLNTTSGGGADLRAAAVTLGSTETRPFRWLDTSTGGTGATNVAAAKFTRLE